MLTKIIATLAITACIAICGAVLLQIDAPDMLAPMALWYAVRQLKESK